MFTERVNVHKMPEIRNFHPDWWHTHGMKMHLDEQQTNHDQVVINNGSVAKLIIVKTNDPHDLPWNVQWSVVHFRGELAEGNRKMNQETLLTAFGFDNKTPKGSEWLIERYGGTCAEQGKFIRWFNYLNIVHPGTGNDGDPNISIELDENIQKAVLSLLPSQQYAESLKNHLGYHLNFGSQVSIIDQVLP